jgi:hypothetical protein
VRYSEKMAPMITTEIQMMPSRLPMCIVASAIEIRADTAMLLL